VLLHSGLLLVLLTLFLVLLSPGLLLMLLLLGLGLSLLILICGLRLLLPLLLLLLSLGLLRSLLLLFLRRGLLGVLLLRRPGLWGLLSMLLRRRPGLFLPLFGLRLLLLFLGLSFFLVMFLLCVRWSNGCEKKEQSPRADKSDRFHDYFLQQSRYL
jgi:hypothetical protein